MSVTSYTPNWCRYNLKNLRDLVMLVPESQVKRISIDNGVANISLTSPDILFVDCFNVELTETESFDERYRFTKTLKFSKTGYVNINFLEERYYALVQVKDGAIYVVNVDFPSKVTYTYNLSENVDQTDFTFSSQSNFPSLKWSGGVSYKPNTCKWYRLNGIKSLELIEKNYAAIEKTDDEVIVYTYGGKRFSIVDFNEDSCSFQETFDGEKITDTIKFDILFDSWQSSWHYTLLEFLENLYSAKIMPKSMTNQLFVGFDFGLQPSYEISSNSNNGEYGKITVTLVDTTNHGLTALNDYEEEHHDIKYWIYVKYAGGYKAYECIGDGIAKYLIKQEILPNGTPTGRYQCLEGYDSMFPTINIVGHFSITEEFPSQECAEECHLYTTIPSYIEYNSVYCNTYTVSGQCDWSIDQLPSYITASPLSGVGNQNYNVEVCNTLTPTDTPVSGSFEIKCGNNSKIVIVKVVDNDYFIKPTSKNINCLPQTVEFTFDNSCPITITSIDPILNYNIGYGVLTVTVPSNYTVFQKVWSISAKDCNGKTQTVTIYQDKMYTRWVTVSGYLCDNGNSYTKEEMYSGTSSTDINTPTYEYRPGTLIQSGDTRCQTYITRWSFLNHYYCVDGNKYKALEEEISYDNGTTWTKTGSTKLGELVEQSSEWCNTPVTYEWRLTTKWQCDSN